MIPNHRKVSNIYNETDTFRKFHYDTFFSPTNMDGSYGHTILSSLVASDTQNQNT
ncbi:MAG: hypothetical protein M0P91_05850 [Sulfuricurvum sp.]|uniref:hypothetical protein n=1 Tax=Sulfuricurvum sp. TaxID=2025608 RepID=UPI0025FEE956|nr:hypothetical protein [Sulfuricurvum sp.]MCK9372702.1 hypothetical protein [Sulfuricurvum sp.]